MTPPKILVLSYWNDPNFGDRLGYQVVQSVLPPQAIVIHASVRPWSVPEEDFDLLVLGTGNSLNAETAARDELFRLLDRVRRVVGVFGTQYKHRYALPVFGGGKRFAELLDRLDMWYARYADDLRLFGAGRKNVTHFGDWLISAFPLTRWTNPKTLVVPADIRTRDIAPDRFIQEIQSFRRVKSFRLHPLLCALTSAEQVAYVEQREDFTKTKSGKFAGLLNDVFGRTYPENELWDVDRNKVAAYKVWVTRNMERLRGELAASFGGPVRSGARSRLPEQS